MGFRSALSQRRCPALLAWGVSSERRGILVSEAGGSGGAPALLVGRCRADAAPRFEGPGCAAMFQGLAIRYPTRGSVKM